MLVYHAALVRMKDKYNDGKWEKKLANIQLPARPNAFPVLYECAVHIINVFILVHQFGANASDNVYIYIYMSPSKLRHAAAHTSIWKCRIDVFVYRIYGSGHRQAISTIEPALFIATALRMDSTTFQSVKLYCESSTYILICGSSAFVSVRISSEILLGIQEQT